MDADEVAADEYWGPVPTDDIRGRLSSNAAVAAVNEVLSGSTISRLGPPYVVIEAREARLFEQKDGRSMIGVRNAGGGDFRLDELDVSDEDWCAMQDVIHREYGKAGFSQLGYASALKEVEVINRNEAMRVVVEADDDEEAARIAKETVQAVFGRSHRPHVSSVSERFETEQVTVDDVVGREVLSCYRGAGDVTAEAPRFGSVVGWNAGAGSGVGCGPWTVTRVGEPEPGLSGTFVELYGTSEQDATEVLFSRMPANGTLSVLPRDGGQ